MIGIRTVARVAGELRRDIAAAHERDPAARGQCLIRTTRTDSLAATSAAGTAFAYRQRRAAPCCGRAAVGAARRRAAERLPDRRAGLRALRARALRWLGRFALECQRVPIADPRAGMLAFEAVHEPREARAALAERRARLGVAVRL